MAGNANRNVSVDITGDSSDLENAYDRSAKKSDDLARKQDDNNKRSSDSFKKMSDTLSSGFDVALDLIGNLGKLGPASVAAVVAAFALLAPAANLAAGGITLGLGGALTGIGILAAAQSSVVRGEFKRLWEDVKNDTVEISGPIQDALLRISNYARLTFGRFKPDLEEAFASLGPALDRFGLDFTQAFSLLAPALQPVSDAFERLLLAVGGKAPEIFGHLESGITHLADMASRNADDIANAIETAFGIFDWAATQLDKFSSYWDSEMASIEDDLNSWMQSFGGSASVNLSDTTDKWKLLVDQMSRAVDQFRENKIVTDDLTISSDALKLAIEGLNNEHLNGDMAASKYREAFDKARETVNENRGAITWYTEEGRKNYDTIFQMVQASQKLILAKSEEGATVREINGLYSTHRSNLETVAREMGFTKKEAKELVDRYLTIPKDINTKISADTGDAQRSVDQFITLNSGRQIPVYLIQKQEMPAKDGGYFGYASGGPVRGPGGSRSDSIPARISRGEYVVNAAATRRNLPLLDAINSGKGVGGMGTTIIYQINTTVSPTANLAAVGAEIVESIQAYETKSGRSWRAN